MTFSFINKTERQEKLVTSLKRSGKVLISFHLHNNKNKESCTKCFTRKMKVNRMKKTCLLPLLHRKRSKFKGKMKKTYSHTFKSLHTYKKDILKIKKVTVSKHTFQQFSPYVFFFLTSWFLFRMPYSGDSVSFPEFLNRFHKFKY